MITVRESWIPWLQALWLSRLGSLSTAAEWMYRLNVFARSIGRHPTADQIYALKNMFVKYLYRHGYAIEVVLHLQEFDCWGTWPDGCSEDCPKCGGTGIYRTEKLYGFRFDVHGKRYAWHQPGKLIDYPVELTEHELAPFTEPARDAAILSLAEAWLGCCVVWWSLLLHGVVADLQLFDTLRDWGKPSQRWFSKKLFNILNVFGFNHGTKR